MRGGQGCELKSREEAERDIGKKSRWRDGGEGKRWDSDRGDMKGDK